MRPLTPAVVAATVVSWLGMYVHNVADLPGQRVLSPETAVPTVVYAGLLAVWFVGPRRPARWALLGWAVLQAVGGGVLSVLPLPILPYAPEQSWYHYGFHALYLAAQLPLIGVLIHDARAERRRT